MVATVFVIVRGPAFQTAPPDPGTASPSLSGVFPGAPPTGVSPAGIASETWTSWAVETRDALEFEVVTVYVTMSSGATRFGFLSSALA